NCGCVSCRRDRDELGCKNPGKCIDTAQALINCIQPKWNPNTHTPDFLEVLRLSEMESEANRNPTVVDLIKSFDPNFHLTKINDGFRIFAFNET
ncbi:hypothetical protein R3P38DRAFT_2361045, partial [Favolaschia claudopus]